MALESLARIVDRTTLELRIAATVSSTSDMSCSPTPRAATICRPVRPSVIPAIKDFGDALDKYIPGLRGSGDFSAPLLWPWAGGQLFLAAVYSTPPTVVSRRASTRPLPLR
ncbi:hypothetical protein ACWEO2_33395 [Nocardia sp. NPDC004278]